MPLDLHTHPVTSKLNLACLSSLQVAQPIDLHLISRPFATFPYTDSLLLYFSSSVLPPILLYASHQDPWLHQPIRLPPSSSGTRAAPHSDRALRTTTTSPRLSDHNHGYDQRPDDVRSIHRPHAPTTLRLRGPTTPSTIRITGLDSRRLPRRHRPGEADPTPLPLLPTPVSYTHLTLPTKRIV